jgi:hypothetical protein
MYDLFDEAYFEVSLDHSQFSDRFLVESLNSLKQLSSGVLVVLCSMEQASVFFNFTLKKFTEKSRELQSTPSDDCRNLSVQID